MSANDRRNINLKNRVQKSKSLNIFTFKHRKGLFSTWGSKGDYYQMELSSGKEMVSTPDGYKKIFVFTTTCNNCKGVGYIEDCEGNSQTICYHCFGAFRVSFDSVNMEIAFHNTYHEAITSRNFGGEVAKVVSTQGGKHLWAVFRRKIKRSEPTTKNLDNLSTRLMRGNEDEGID